MAYPATYRANWTLAAVVARDSGFSPQETEAISKIPVADMLTVYEFERAAKRRGGGMHSLLAWSV